MGNLCAGKIVAENMLETVSLACLFNRARQTQTCIMPETTSIKNQLLPPRHHLVEIAKYDVPTQSFSHKMSKSRSADLALAIMTLHDHSTNKTGGIMFEQQFRLFIRLKIECRL